MDKIYFLGLIIHINSLIDEVEYLLDTATDATYLNGSLGMLAQWGVEIYTYIQDNPDMDLLRELKCSGPLYVLMLTAQMPSETRDSISQYCKWIAMSREWVKSKSNARTLNIPQKGDKIIITKSKAPLLKWEINKPYIVISSWKSELKEGEVFVRISKGNRKYRVIRSSVHK